MEGALIEAGYTPYWRREDEDAVTALVCCCCRRGVRYVGMHKRSIRWAYGVCSQCDTWICFLGLVPGEGRAVAGGS
jgi:hypothetical protein